MKRAGNLFDAIVERDNLRVAFWKACRGKRDRAETRRFAQHLDDRLADLAHQLYAGTFVFGRFSQFVIHDPKERIITAPCFTERVAHHAIMSICEPVIERWLIPDTFACRVGRGRVAAVNRAATFARRFRFFMKLDIRKYFDSVSHARLLERLGRRFKDWRVQSLFDQVVRSFRGKMGRGLPIGSLTSQHFANFYLGWFDRLVKEVWRILGYVRYMDDMALWSNNREELRCAFTATQAWLRSELDLELKGRVGSAAIHCRSAPAGNELPDYEPVLNRTSHGMDFLGCQVFPNHVALNRRSRVRFRRKLASLEQAYESGLLTEEDLQTRATALVAFTRAAGVSSWRSRRGVIDQLGESATRLGPGQPGRELEQLRQELPVGEPQ